MNVNPHIDFYYRSTKNQQHLNNHFANYTEKIDEIYTKPEPKKVLRFATDIFTFVH